MAASHETGFPLGTLRSLEMQRGNGMDQSKTLRCGVRLMTPGTAAVYQFRAATTDRERAAEDLMKVIQQKARDVGRAMSSKYSLPRQFINDLVSDSVSKVWKELDKYDIDKGPFEGWCYQVISNLALDKLRKKPPRQLPVNHETGQEIDFEDPHGKEDSRSDSSMDWGTLGPQIMKIIDNLSVLSVKQKVIFVAISGCYVMVKQKTWGSWLKELKIKPPFPPSNFLQKKTTTDRAKMIADLLSMKWNAVRIDYYRTCQKLREELRHVEP